MCTRATPRRRTVNTLTLALLCCALACAAGGCNSTKWVELRETPRNPWMEQLSLLSPGGDKPSPRTMQVLRRYNFADKLSGDRSDLIAQLDQFNQRERSREIVYAVAELAYLQARRTEANSKVESLALYGSSVTHAYEYLFDVEYRPAVNSYDPQFRGACDLYNVALEGTLRLALKQQPLKPGTTVMVSTPGRQCQVQVKLNSTGWHADDIDSLKFVSDYSIGGLTNKYHEFGLGVPLIAVRRQHEHASAAEQFYPEQLTFPLTAFLRVHSTPTSAATASDTTESDVLHVVLELHDPLTTNTLQIADRQVPLETDLSTPLAYFLSQPTFDDSMLATLGLVDPEVADEKSGLYMLEPYRPDKIPVVMVHGLWSSPVTWMEMFNDLRSDPTLRQHYQFWFYLYPSGRPFWLSAAQFRRDLAHMRSTLDPSKQVAPLDQMVLVGHSMGGLVSKLQTVDSGNAFWETLSERPFSELQASDDVRRALGETFFFQPNPSVRRVVTMGTPHRGSHFANDLTRWLGRKLVNIPTKMLAGKRQIVSQNPDYFRDGAPLDIDTSIDSLSPDSPLLPALLAAEPGPWVTYHNVAGRLPRDDFFGKLTAKFGSEGDGVVSLASAQADNAATEIVVPADHSTVHRHPKSILELRHILLTHIQELRNGVTATNPNAQHGSIATQPVRRLPPTPGFGDSSSHENVTTQTQRGPGEAVVPPRSNVMPNHSPGTIPAQVP